MARWADIDQVLGTPITFADPHALLSSVPSTSTATASCAAGWRRAPTCPSPPEPTTTPPPAASTTCHTAPSTGATPTATTTTPSPQPPAEPAHSTQSCATAQHRARSASSRSSPACHATRCATPQAELSRSSSPSSTDSSYRSSPSWGYQLPPTPSRARHAHDREISVARRAEREAEPAHQPVHGLGREEIHAAGTAR